MKDSKFFSQDFPLSSSQYGVYMECRMEPQSTMYNLPRYSKLPAGVEAGRLRDAIRRTVQAHPAMSAVFSMDGETPVMRYAPKDAVLPEISAASPEDATAQFVSPFDLENGPLYRFVLCHCPDGEYLLYDIHHLVYDGTSNNAMLGSIIAAYEGREIPEEEITVYDVALSEKGLEESEKYKAAKEYFAGQLCGVETDATILPDMPADAAKGADRLELVLDLDPAKAEAFCDSLGVKESALFQAAFGYTLALFSGVSDVCFATVTNGRHEKGVYGSVGMFVKTVPMRLPFAQDDSVASYVQKARESYVGARKHDCISFAELLHEYGINTDISFTYQGYLNRLLPFLGEGICSAELERPDTQMNMDVSLYRDEKSYVLLLHWRKNVYSRGLMESFADTFANVAKGMTECEKLCEIPLMSQRQASLLDAFNNTEVPYDNTKSMVDLFREAAAKFPDHVAAVFKDESLTFAQLDNLTDRLAAYLSSQGIGKGGVVSVLISRSINMPVAALGALKTGAAYQPLDPTYPPERLGFMIKDADAGLLIADEDLLHLLPEYHGKVLLSKDIPALPEAKAPEYRPVPGDRFILLYTSGSTGVPKGVQLTHGNLVAFCHWFIRYYGMDENNRTLAYASFGFDACMMEMYPPLVTGSALYILPEDKRLDFGFIDSYVRENKLNNGFMTTQVGRMFAVTMGGSTLDYLTMGGEKLVPFEPQGHCRYINAYGPTECTICATVYPVERFEQDLPIGRALDNLKLYVMDPFGRSLPVGVPGELCISGPQLAIGYLNRPEKNAEAFVMNPFCTEKPYDRMYRTGDVVARRNDGNIMFIGRRDMQVKIRGFRIELTEVEEVIRRFEGIKDATVAAFDSETGGKFIAAYVVSDKPVDVEALNRFIRSEKPPYMVPAATVQLEKIPLNQNQKVNRRALPKPELKSVQTHNASAAPLNKLEAALAEIVDQVLHVKVDDVTAPLADFGLTSITSIRLATLVYKKYNVTLAVSKLASTATLQSIENSILEATFEKAGEPAEETKAAEQAPETAPLSFAQQGVYADCQLDPESTKYNMPFCLSFPEGIGAEQLKKAVLGVVAAHPSMHTKFASDDRNEIMQVRVKNYAPAVEIRKTDARGLEEEKKAFVRPFALTQDVPARFEIVEAEGRIYLLLDLHHLIADGASIDLFASQLCALLDGREIEAESEDYFSFASAQKIDPEDEEYFAGRMAVAEEASRLIPDVFAEGLPHTEKSVSAATDLDAAAALAKRLGVTPAAVYLAAVQLCVSRYLYEDVSAIATISGGRANLRMNNTVGMFVNTLPLTVSIGRGTKTDDFIRAVGEDFTQAILHEQYPFAKTAAKFDFHPAVSYAWQVGVIQEYRLNAGQVGFESLTAGDAKIPVSVFIEESAGAGAVHIAYDSALYSSQMMEGFAASVANVAKELALRDTLDGISLTGEEQWKKLDSYNRPFDLGFNRENTVVSGFRAQVCAHPDKIAAVYEDRRFTYSELDELTDRLAKVIYKKISGATGKENLAECVVSILCGRNENAFIMPLAVLKSGCAYEPMDPSYPRERLNFMTGDAGASLLLVQDGLRDLIDVDDGKVMLFSELFAADIPDVAPVEPKPEDLFIMLYTSGSTGTPKGVQIEHRNMIAYAYGSSREGFYTDGCVTAAYASFGFDVNMADTFCTLLNGGTVHLIPESIRMNLDKLSEYFDANGVTTTLLTTQVGVQFMQNYPKLKSLKYLTVGGEKLPAVHPEELSYTLNNGYGPTENCCGVSLFPVREWESNIPLGKPMRTIHGYVLDRTGHRLPAGAAGEYCLSGPQVSRGYLNRPEKTAEAYADCPFNEFRMYHTGDVVRYRENGDVEFVGRKDGQVKIRGFRVETKEIEAVIRDMEGVKDVTVQACDYEAGGKYLAAWVVFEGDFDAEAVAEYVRGRKPAYMVPAAIMQIEKIPLTINQKVDKKALPRPTLRQHSFVAPKNKAEEAFCGIFGQLLGIEKVSADDDFFALGGSSITAMRVVIAAGKAGYSIVYQDVFNNPTPEAMAKFLNADEPETAETEEEDDGACAAIPEIGPDGYDYAPVHELLAKNTVENFNKGPKQPLGDVLLAGATGYLGSHVLKELLDNYSGKIWCMVRPGKDKSGAERLKDLLDFYFGGVGEDVFDSRIRVLEGDSTDAATLKSFRAEGITVINCAASVKHFAKDNEIEKTNVETVRRLIEWCLGSGSRLVHISTESVMGEAVGNMPPEGFRFTEHVLYAGQRTDGNQYVSSKFAAERMVYDAILKQGLSAKVIRMGNLAPRYNDGKFQINANTNSFIRNMAAYAELGAMPYAAVDAQVEFSPIEYAARAVVLLSRTPEDCVCFMASNGHLIPLGDAVFALEDGDNEIKLLENEAFGATLAEALANPDRSDKVSCLMAYNHSGKEKNVRVLGPETLDTSLTRQILYRMGFRWPVTDSAYVRRFACRLPELFGKKTEN